MATVKTVLRDPRGWAAYGHAFDVRADQGWEHPNIVVTLTPTEDMRRMFPMFSDLNMTVFGDINEVFIHAGRWLQELPNKSRLLPEAYKTYAINHEIGHCLGFPHPPVNSCTPDGESMVMNQQTLGTTCAKPNPYPTPMDNNRASYYFGFIVID